MFFPEASGVNWTLLHTGAHALERDSRRGQGQGQGHSCGESSVLHPVLAQMVIDSNHWNSSLFRHLNWTNQTAPINLTSVEQYKLCSTNQGLSLDGRRKNSTRESTGPLKKWLHEHIKNPYPTKTEKVMLAIISRMTLTQVSTWFANARRRLKKETKFYDEDDDDGVHESRVHGNEKREDMLKSPLDICEESDDVIKSTRVNYDVTKSSSDDCDVTNESRQSLDFDDFSDEDDQMRNKVEKDYKIRNKSSKSTTYKSLQDQNEYFAPGSADWMTSSNNCLSRSQNSKSPHATHNPNILSSTIPTSSTLTSSTTSSLLSSSLTSEKLASKLKACSCNSIKSNVNCKTFKNKDPNKPRGTVIWSLVDTALSG